MTLVKEILIQRDWNLFPLQSCLIVIVIFIIVIFGPSRKEKMSFPKILRITLLLKCWDVLLAKGLSLKLSWGQGYIWILRGESSCLLPHSSCCLWLFLWPLFPHQQTPHLASRKCALYSQTGKSPPGVQVYSYSPILTSFLNQVYNKIDTDLQK